MLSILLIFFIWKYYSELATQHNKSKWGFALLGIATYYIGIFLGGMVIATIDLLANTHFFDESSNIMLSFLSLPFGLLFVWGLFKLLEHKWETKKFRDNNASDDNLLESNNV